MKNHQRNTIQYFYHLIKVYTGICSKSGTRRHITYQGNGIRTTTRGFNIRAERQRQQSDVHK